MMRRGSAQAAVAAGLSLAQRWQIARAQAERILTRKPWDESEHPRDPAGSSTGGQFTGDGGGTEASSGPPSIEHDPVVVEVGGDEWNRAAAKRLEQQYQAARPKLDTLAQDAPGRSSTVASDEEDEEPPFVPEEWEMLSGSAQEDAKTQFISQNKQDYYDSEVQHWHDGGNALDDAKVIVASDFSTNDEWAAEAVADYRAAREEAGERPIPYTDEQLLESISLDYEAGYEGNGDLDLDFDDAKLKEPSSLPPPEQGNLPGIEPADPSAQLTEEMRDSLTKAIESAFDDEAQKKSESLEPPEYLAESVDEYVAEAWEQKDDDDKFEWTKNNTNLVESESTEGSGGTVELETVEAPPTKYDPLNETNSAQDYRRTQQLGRYLSIARAKDILAEREIAHPTDSTLGRVDRQLWSAWKSSSTSENGRLLQVASADELGGRLNTKTSRDLDRDGMIRYADKEFSSIGGYDGVKAYVRAKWETTQYLLDRAGIKELELYRGIRLDQETYQKRLKHLAEAVKIGDHQHLQTLHVARNGAASTSVNRSVANDWGHIDNRVVLRALVPRTAALSVPAFGINIHAEREVVVAGTAWKGWDAWAGKAPDFDDVPLKQAA